VLLYIVGFVSLFVFPPLGLVFLVVAVLLSILSLTWTREQRHGELLAATGGTKTARARPVAPSTADRLRELQALHEDGLLTDEEYEQKRTAIVDGM
jgi:hypothetical protein